MRFRSGMMCALAAALVLGGCAPAATGGAAGRVSASGRVYEPGTPPRETAQSRAATLAVATSRFQDALTAAQAGIAADTANPIHYFLAGEAAAGLGQFELADSMWRRAEQIYPAYELEVEPSREQHWAAEFTRAGELYNAGNIAGAIEAWTNAHEIYKLRPEAAQNLAIVLSQEERYDDAIRVYTEALENLNLVPAARVIDPAEQTERDAARVDMENNLVQIYLFTERWADAEALLRRLSQSRPNDIEVQANLATALAGLGRTMEANEIYTRLLSTPNLPPSQLFSIGVSLFSADQHRQAAEAFGRVTQLIPNHRDAWFNQANALYSAQAWNELVPVAARHAEVDPLSETARLIQARAFTALNQNNQALEVLTLAENYPIVIEDMQISPTSTGVVVRATIRGNAAPAGTPVRLNFTFYGENGNEVGSQMVTVNAPARDAEGNFEVRLDQPAVAYRYQLVR